MLFEITHKQDRSVLFSLETESIKLCVEAAARSGTNLGGTNLGGANLGGANLRGANLGGANLGGANLGGANLGGAKILDDVIITKAPIQISGFEWPVTIWDRHMQIGCEFHSHEEWQNFSEADWLRMGSKEALNLKHKQFPLLLGLCNWHRPKSEKENQVED